LSGPAGGIVGAKNIVEASSLTKIDETGDALSKIITFDMGGTSTDVSLINKEPTFTTDLCIGGYPIHLPVLDIHTIGAGGGSIAYVDAGGSLRVGPQSAGAHPGPACYGIGESPTVTDANLVLGRLIPDYFLGGNMKLFPEKALASIKKLGDQLGLDLIRTANGIIDVVNIQMEHALRLISVERGHDPREYDLFSFGGAGGLHACALARHVGIPRVIIPKHASTLSAYGMLTSNVIKDYVLTVMLPGTTSMEKIREIMQPLIDRSRLEMRKQGYLARQTEIQTSLDMRYVGQSYELNIPFSNNFTQDFQAKHSFTFGYHFQDKSIEIVNIRVKAIGINPSIQFPAIKKTKKASKLEPVKFIDVFLNYKKSHIPLFLFDRLIPGNQIKGPSLIVADDTTIFIDQENDVFVDNYLNLIININ
jgi:N-methylhydantoinase A/oxoprolinase/acetone carboxylase beta subunit